MINCNGMYIEINNYCNLNCIFCYNRSKKPKENEYMSINTINDIVEWAKLEKIKTIIISGGEPFLYPNFIELLDIIKNNQEFNWHIATNGTIVEDSIINKIKDLNIIIHLSVHSHNILLDKKIRGVCLFNKTLEFMKKLKESNVKFFFKTVINRINYDYIEDIYQFAIDNGGVPTFTYTNNDGSAIDNWNKLEITNKEKILIFNKLKDLDKKNNINDSLTSCINDCPLLDINKNIYIYINYLKEIYPCQLISDKKYMIGEFNISSTTELINNIKKINLILKQRLTIDYGCENCFLKKDCMHGCCAKALLENKDILSNDNNCDIRRQEIFKMIGIKL